MTCRPLLIGIDFFATRSSSDKNFWHEVLGEFSGPGSAIERIEIWSFNHRSRDTEALGDGASSLATIHNVAPTYLGPADHESSSGNRDKVLGRFNVPPHSLVDRPLSLARSIRRIQQLVREHGLTNVHLMDNFGPAMGLLAKAVAPVPVSVSIMGYYQPSPRRDFLLRQSLRGCDAIVGYNDAISDRLQQLVAPSTHVTTIRWGVTQPPVDARPQSNEDAVNDAVKDETRDAVKIVWTGYIMQIREPELLASLKAAKEVCEATDDVRFSFLLKPECPAEQYQHLAGDRIEVRNTVDNEDFMAELAQADYLLSPVLMPGTIVTPPLTWLEAMSRGVTVVSNEVDGYREVFGDTQGVPVARNPADLAAAVLEAATKKPDDIQRQANKQIVAERYNVGDAAGKYVELWASLAEQASSGVKSNLRRGESPQTRPANVDTKLGTRSP